MTTGRKSEDFASERYWMGVIVDQARRAVAAWNEGRSLDADMFSLEKHLLSLDEAKARGHGAECDCLLCDPDPEIPNPGGVW